MQKFVMERNCVQVRLASFPLLGIFLIIIFLTIPQTVVHAQLTESQPNFTIQPATYNPAIPATKSYFILDAKPGATLSEKIRVTNAGTATGSASIYPVSATTAQTSGIVYLSKKDPLRDVASWTEMDQQQLNLIPGQSQIISFQITVPAKAHPGQYVGGITAENLVPQSLSTNGSLHINLQKLSTIAVQVNVPGTAIEQMKVTGITAGGSNGYQSLLVSMSNTGGMMINPSGDLRVSNAQRQLLQVLPLKLDIILPDTSINYPLYVQKKALTAGDYQVSLHLNYGHGKTLDYTTKLTITQDQVKQAFSNGPLQAPTGNSTGNSMPLWQMILVALAALIILLMGGKKAYDLISAHRRKQTKNGPTPPTDGSHRSIDTSKRRDQVLK